MKKLFKLLILIIILDISLFIYLKNSLNNKKQYLFIDKNEPIVYQFKDIVLNDICTFDFNSFFEVIGFNENPISSKIIEDKVSININNKLYEYSYELIEPEIIEKEIVKEVIVYEEPYKYDDYFNILNSYLCFSEGTDLNTIIYDISNNIDTNVQATIDYSQLNPNVCGQYTVFFNTEIGNYSIIVEII